MRSSCARSSPGAGERQRRTHSETATSLEDDLDRLYEAPLDEFVRRRDELSRALRKERRRDEAESVKRLVKPSAAAWAVNQLARREPGALRELLSAADRLRDVQAAGDAEFAAVAAPEREALAALVDRAAEIVRETGRAPTEATLNRVRTTLQAAAADPGVRPDVERGRLTRELEAPGFGGLLAAVPAAPTRKRRAGGDEVARARERRDARRAVEAARERVEEARASVRAAEQAVTAAEAELDAARRRLEDADADATRAEERLREIERG